MSPEDDFDIEATDLYRKWVGRVQRFLIGMGCDRGLAEEIADDAFLGARRRWGHVRNLSDPAGYVFKIARNERSKRQKRYDASVKDLCSEPPEVFPYLGDDFTQQIADREAVRQALRRLAPCRREAVTLRYVVDLSEATAAEIMGISIGAVKRYAYEGREELGGLLAEFRPRREGRNP